MHFFLKPVIFRRGGNRRGRNIFSNFKTMNVRSLKSKASNSKDYSQLQPKDDFRPHRSTVILRLVHRLPHHTSYNNGEHSDSRQVRSPNLGTVLKATVT